MPQKSRKQLEAEGVLLDGPIVPDWFKSRCDGCSAPLGLKKYKIINQLTSACYIHDLRYTCIPIVFSKKSVCAKFLRKKSDLEFLSNCRLIVSANGNRPFRGVLLSRMVYLSVRCFGRWALSGASISNERMPRNKSELRDLQDVIFDMYPKTKKADAFLRQLNSTLL